MRSTVSRLWTTTVVLMGLIGCGTPSELGIASNDCRTLHEQVQGLDYTLSVSVLEGSQVTVAVNLSEAGLGTWIEAGDPIDTHEDLGSKYNVAINGRVYSFWLKKVNCNLSILLLNDEYIKCSDVMIEACPDNVIMDPVCGIDGEDYRCAQHACNNVEFYKEGECREIRECDPDFDYSGFQPPTIYSPVCGDDGAVYNNGITACEAGVLEYEDHGSCVGSVFKQDPPNAS